MLLCEGHATSALMASMVALAAYAPQAVPAM